MTQEVSAQKSPLMLSDERSKLLSWLPIVLVSMGIALLVSKIALDYWGNISKGNKSDAKISPSKNEVQSAPIAETIKVDIAGAVLKEGIFTLPKDSRMENLLISAGGLKENANEVYISKYLNRAQKLQDGMKIYIPFKDEPIGPGNASVLGVATNITNGIVNINTASDPELEALPGIGSVTAGKIINGRPYQSLEELVTRKIIYKSVYEKIKDKISVN